MAGKVDAAEEGRMMNGKAAASSSFNNILRASQVTSP
jgi:hypothetical protein